jgi:hypothetical protein
MISRRSLTWTSRPRLQKRTMSMRSLVIGATLLFAGCAGMQMATTEASAQNACEPTITSTTVLIGWGPDADRRTKLLISQTVKGSLLGAYSQ